MNHFIKSFNIRAFNSVLYRKCITFTTPRTVSWSRKASCFCQNQIVTEKRRHFSSSSSSSSSSSATNVTSESSPSPSNSLIRELSRKITFTGPITVHEYMAQALTHPKYGFYMNQDVFGSAGHFTTSPEVCQLFGELIGIWILYEWMKGGQRGPLRIVELGPGRGTLSLDISRVLSQFEQTKGQTEFHLVEVSPHLKTVQQNTICGGTPEGTRTRFGQPISWHLSLDHLPTHEDGFTIFLANEFFDAFPIYKFVKVPEDSEWRELLVDIDPQDSGKLRWIRSKFPTPASKIFASKRVGVEGDHLEACPDAIIAMEKIVDRLDGERGGLLVIDYGFDPLIGPNPVNRDTFRAYRSHSPWDPLLEPGTADLTYDLDFEHIRNSLKDRGSSIFGSVTQEHFLKALGIELRMKMLLQSVKDEAQRKELQSGVDMLIKEMGTRFKVMAVFGAGYKGVPVGFE